MKQQLPPINKFTLMVMLLLLSTIILVMLTNFTHSHTPLQIAPNLYEFGVAVDKGTARGVVSTVCGGATDNTTNINTTNSSSNSTTTSSYECLLILLMDFTETTAFTMYSILIVNIQTGETKSMEFPGSPLGGVIASNYASLLEDSNKRFYYFHFGATFYQFDAKLLQFTFYKRTHTGMAMALTMDDIGQVWGGTYPKCGLFSFNPNMGILNDYGFIYNQTWDMYPRSIASDDLGFIYIGIAFTKSQFLVFKNSTNEFYPLLEESDRLDGSATLYRDLDGAVYGNQGGSSILYKLYNGTLTSNVSKKKTAKIYLTGSQDYIYRTFNSGSLLQFIDVANKNFIIKLKNGTLYEKTFTYSCRGANVMDLISTPNRNLLIGSTSFPMSMFTMNSREMESLQNYAVLDQWNTMRSSIYDKDYIWIGSYPEGNLLRYSHSQPYKYTIIGNNQTNPVFIGTGSPHVNRPSCVLIHPNMELVLMSGKPAYGKTGGGLLIYNRISNTIKVLNHTQLIQYHSIYSMTSIKSMKNIILCGTTTDPGTGGITIAKESELFLFDLNTLQIVKRFYNPFKGVNHYYELFECLENDLIYGYTDTKVFFVYNPIIDKIIHNRTIDRVFVEQGPHSFTTHPLTNETFITVSTGIYKINSTNFQFEKVFSPSKLLMFNGVILNDGFYYFRADTKIYGYKLFNETKYPNIVSGSGSMRIPISGNSSSTQLNHSNTIQTLNVVILMNLLILITFLIY